MRRTPTHDRARIGTIGGLLALYAALGLRGYGNDNDTYHMIHTWNVLCSQGVYQPSRNTGYLVPEMAIGFLSSVGGHPLSNFVASVLAALVLWLLFGTVRRHTDRATAIVATLAVGLHPVWIIAASTSIDYLYSLSFLAIGIWAMERRRPFVAAAFFGASVSARITFAMAVVAVHVAAAIAHRDDRTQPRRWVVSLGGAGLLASLLLLPALSSSGWTLDFLTVAEAQPFDLVRAGANDVLEHLVFWGVPALLLIASYFVYHGPRLVRLLLRPGTVTPPVRFLLLSGLFVIAWFELLFLRLPAEAAYLLPTLPAVVLIMALLRHRLPGRLSQLALALLVGFEILHGLVRLDVFRLGFEKSQPTTLLSTRTILTMREGIPLRSHPGETASVGIYLEEGVLVEDASRRRQAQAQWTEWLRDTWPDHPR